MNNHSTVFASCTTFPSLPNATLYRVPRSIRSGLCIGKSPFGYVSSVAKDLRDAPMGRFISWFSVPSDWLTHPGRTCGETSQKGVRHPKLETVSSPPQVTNPSFTHYLYTQLNMVKAVVLGA